MSTKSRIEVLAEIVGEPEITRYLDGCSQGTLNHVERCLHSVVAADAHPSAAYQSRIRAGLMDDIWSSIWECGYHDYMTGLILDRIVFATQKYDRHDPELLKELRILANLWDKSTLPGDLYEECEIVEGLGLSIPRIALPHSQAFTRGYYERGWPSCALHPYR
jgi:hypothetical protein